MERDRAVGPGPWPRESEVWTLPGRSLESSAGGSGMRTGMGVGETPLESSRKPSVRI